MKWPFSRRNDVTSVPEEIREYYQTERRERTGIAWLLALGTLIVTVVVALALFFAGRWVYRTIADRGDDKTGQTTEQAAKDESNDASDSESTSSSVGTTSSPSSSTPTPTPATPATTPAAGSSASTAADLPNTGPGDTAGIVLATAVIAGTAHYVLSSRRRTE